VNSSAISASFPAAERELELLESLKVLLAAAMDSLGQGDAQTVPDISQQISLTAQELAALSLQISRLPQGVEAQLKRKEFLLEVRQQSAFCRAILRRWRRSIILRQQLLEMRTQSMSYPGHFTLTQEP
jgi:hypothetical protein